MRLLVTTNGIWYSGAQISTNEFLSFLTNLKSIEVKMVSCLGGKFIPSLANVEIHRVPCWSSGALLHMKTDSVFEQLIRWADVVWIATSEFAVAKEIKRIKKLPVVAHLHSYEPICPIIWFSYGFNGVCGKECSPWLSIRCKQETNIELAKIGLLNRFRAEAYWLLDYGSRSIISMRAYGGLVNDYYDGYITNYDCKEGIATYMNKAHVPIKELEKSSDIGFAVENGWAYNLANKYWTKSNVRFRHMHWPILEVFDFGNYEGIDVNGKVVIDVGAFVGDTAIYFILKGARKVIAIEPLPANYEELLDNIHLNSMEGRIIPINAMVNSKRMIVEVPTNVPINIRGGSINEFKRHGAGDYVNIESITLSDVINKFKVNPANAVLKLDCEGCEYEIILNDYEHIKLFKEVIFEYHAYITNRSVTELMNIMNKDFSCQLMNENFYKKYFNNYTKDKLGLVMCVKNRQ